MMKRPMEKRLIWLNGQILPLDEAKINILSPTTQFGANVFEGIRCYWNEDSKQLYAFRLAEHYQRLKKSIKIFRMEDKYSIDEMQQGLIDVIKANEYKEDIAVRQTIFIDGFGSWMSKGPVGMFIAPIPKPGTESIPNGFRCAVSSWERISEKNLSPKVKVGANYINSRMAQIEALENGYDTAILMNSHGKISEGTGSCLFIVRDGLLITPPVTASILESITRETIIKLAREVLNIETVERDIDRTELYICDEVFLCGSAVEITPVINVDGYTVKNGKVGDITMKIYEEYFKVLRGNSYEYYKWLTPIY